MKRKALFLGAPAGVLAAFAPPQYSPTSPFGSSGAHYYARTVWRWRRP